MRAHGSCHAALARIMATRLAFEGMKQSGALRLEVLSRVALPTSFMPSPPVHTHHQGLPCPCISRRRKGDVPLFAPMAGPEDLEIPRRPRRPYSQYRIRVFLSGQRYGLHYSKQSGRVQTLIAVRRQTLKAVWQSPADSGRHSKQSGRVWQTLKGLWVDFGSKG